MKAVRWLLISLLCVGLCSAASVPVQAGGAPIQIAVWADGQLSDGGNGIFAFINGIPGYNATMVTTAQLNIPGYLSDNGFSAIYVTRSDALFGGSLGPVAAGNVADYVGSNGAVVLFMNDWDDNLPTSFSGDPPDALTSELIQNAIALAAGSGNGYVGEFNGGAMGLAANFDGLSPLNFFAGTAGPLGGFGCQSVTITDAGSVIQGDVPTMFMPVDFSCFRTVAAGVSADFIFATYTDGAPTIIGSAGGARAVVGPASNRGSTASKQ